MDIISRSVLRAIAYGEQFDYPLTLKEIWWRLPGDQPVSLMVVKKKLLELVKQGQVLRKGLYFQLPADTDFTPIRAKRQSISQEKWPLAQTAVKKLRWIPWLQGLAVTGSLAMDNATQQADVDFLVITQPRRLWLTRLVVTGVAWAAGRRRSWHHEEPNSWCFNLWLDSEHLEMRTDQRSLYTAYEVIQASWVFDPAHVRSKFYAANSWIADYLPNAAQELLSVGISQPVGLVSTGWLDPVGWLDWLAFLAQTWYMKPHRSRERVERGGAFFHPRDTQKIVELGLKQSLAQATKESSRQRTGAI